MIRFHSAAALLEFPSAPALSRAFFTSNAIWNMLLKKAVWDSRSEENGVVDQLLFVCSGIGAGFFLKFAGRRGRGFIYSGRKVFGRRVVKLEEKMFMK